ncbi:MAG: PD-(D/E)XK nuclease family protein [Gammaproteobacteria bacterium]
MNESTDITSDTTIDLIQALAEGAEVITANQRQMADLSRRYAAWQVSRGERVWDTPRIATFDVWLRELWQADDGEGRFLLNTQQAQAIWEWVIETDDSSAVAEHLQTPRIARMAADAWQLVHEWRLPWPLPESMRQGDVATFVRWAERFVARCDALNAMDTGRLIPGLIHGLAARARALPKRLIVHGLEELTPAQQALLAAVEAMGCPVSIQAPVGHGELSSVPVFACADGRAELATAANWAKARLAEDETQRIAIVVPDLASVRSRLIAVFNEHLQPRNSIPEGMPGNHQQASLFDLSLGEPLAMLPMIRAALIALELGVVGRLPVARVGELLHSPTIAGGDSEASARSILDARLREDGDPEVRMAWLVRRAADERFMSSLPLLRRSLKGLRDALKEADREMTAVDCVEQFWAALKAVGWARGGREMISADYQALEAFKEVMTQLAGLDRVLPPQSLRAWLGRLRALLQGRIFQARGNRVNGAAAPIQVMGLMEAVGLEFDALWVMGLDDETLPAVARPNPLLPLALQRERDLPHATPNRELSYARGLLRHLASAATDRVFSFPQRDGDQELNVSPLLASNPQRQAKPIPVYPWRMAMLQSQRVSTLSDDLAPALARDEAVSGGTGVLSAQAQCPFKAFALYRLNSRGLDEPDIGLDPSERGSLTHRVLELVWKEVKTQAALIALGDDGRQECVRRLAGQVMEQERSHRPGRYTERLFQLEMERLVRLALEWLQLDLDREPFEAVDLEEKREIEVAGLRLRVQVDRMDRLTDGRQVIWDYKTGGANAPSANAWLGERPDEPQLPIYATYTGDQVDGLGFAWVKAGKSKRSGLACDDEVAKATGLKAFGKVAALKEEASWNAILDAWRDELAVLSQDFQAGKAEVDPKNDGACRYCEQGTLCRVHEVLNELGDADETDAGEGWE